MATVGANKKAQWKQGAEGEELTVSMMITGLAETGLAKIAEAMALDDVPGMGDVHPDLDTLYVSGIRLKSLDAKVLELEHIYTGRSSGIDNDFGFGTGGSGDSMEVGATVISEDRNADGDNVPLSVSYTDAEGVVHEQGGMVTILVPQMTKTFTRRTTYDPAYDAIDFVGAVNSAIWPLMLEARAGELLCTGIVGRSSDWGQTWEVTYSFQYNSRGWDSQQIVYIDPETGRPPDDVVDGNGVETITGMYELRDFAGLQL